MVMVWLFEAFFWEFFVGVDVFAKASEVVLLI